MHTTPIHTRPLDWLFVVVCSTFACTSLLFDVIPTLAGLIFGDPKIWPLAPAGLELYAAIDPLLVADPVFFRVAVAWSGFVWGPVYVYMAWAFHRGDPRVRIVGLMYAAGMSVAMSMIFAEELLSSVPAWRTPEPLRFAAYNLAYLLFPVAVFARLRKPLPFGPPPVGDETS